MIYHYIIPDIPPSNNKFIGKNERWKYQEVKKEWAKKIKLFCSPKPKAPIKRAFVRLSYSFPDRRRRDPDNYSGKMILDGLVKAGIIEDDSFNNIDLRIRGEFGEKQKATHIFIVNKEEQSAEE